jgi:hypothetical protein
MGVGSAGGEYDIARGGSEYCEDEDENCRWMPDAAVIAGE